MKRATSVSPSVKRMLLRAFILFVILCAGFALSSGIVTLGVNKLLEKAMPGIKELLYHHILTLGVDAKHYFLLPVNGYTGELYTEPLPFAAVAVILGNSVFNILFQPVFLCPFTPQVILNVMLAPFFIYGAVKYFKKAWFIIIIFLILSFRVGIYDSGVEALIRHGMSCELIYLLIGTAGFTGWITKKS